MKYAYIVYSLPECSYCTRAKTLLDNYGATYRELMLDRDVTRDDIVRACEHYGHGRTMPLIVSIDEYGNEERVGGYTELSEHMKT